jgi:hypothetical protein
MKKLLALLLAMLLLAATFVFASCDDDGETDGQGSSTNNGKEPTDEELEEIYSGLFGKDFEDLFGEGGLELPDDEF